MKLVHTHYGTYNYYCFSGHVIELENKITFFLPRPVRGVVYKNHGDGLPIKLDVYLKEDESVFYDLQEIKLPVM